MITLDTEINETETVTTNESGAELATAPDEKQDKTDDGVQKAINKQHAKYREEERKRIAAEDETKTLKEKLSAIEAEKGEVTIPEIPDSFDEDFDEKVKLRDQAIMRQATKDANDKLEVERLNANEVAARQAEQERFTAKVEGYNKHIVTLGLNADEIRKAGETVVNYGISGDVAEHILEQEDGPLITKYLADNPVILDDLRNMTVIQAAMKINSDIRIAASSLKPQASTAPDPAETLSGRGAGEQVNPLIKGIGRASCRERV